MRRSFSRLRRRLSFKDITAIPISARYGDNVSSRSKRTPWYSGPHLLDYLETVDVEDDRAGKPFRMPVQWVNRPNSDFRGFAGTIVSGSVKPGDEIVVLPSGQTTKIKRIVGAGGDLDAAQAGDAVTVTLADEIDIARGDMLAAPRDRPQVADQFAAHLVWMAAERLLPGRSYLMKINNSTMAATVTELKHRIDINTLSKLAAKTLALNEVGVCNLSVARADRVRSLRRQPRHRRLHSDRSLFQRDGRRRHDRFRAAPRHQYPSPAIRPSARPSGRT